MRTVLLCEGKSESALRDALKSFLDAHCDQANRPKVKLEVKPFDGPPSPGELRRRFDRHAENPEVLGVIALTDVYPRFRDAGAAKEFLRGCVRDSLLSPKFHAHAAQMELEAWLLPYWSKIAKHLGVNAKPPGANPEEVDDQKPPSRHLKELYRRGKRSYEKPLDAAKILSKYGVEEAARACPELKKLLDTLTMLCDLPNASIAAEDSTRHAGYSSSKPEAAQDRKQDQDV